MEKYDCFKNVANVNHYNKDYCFTFAIYSYRFIIKKTSIYFDVSKYIIMVRFLS